MKSSHQKIGLISATSLVVGNMIGAGVFVLPAALSKYGSIGLIGWLISAFGAIVLAIIFSSLSKIISDKSGGPYVYSKNGFGDFIGFLVAWGYWVCTWIGNGAIVISVIGASGFFFPTITNNPVFSVTYGISIIWILTYINTRGIKDSAIVQIITTLLKLFPILIVIVFGIFFFDISNFPKFNLTNNSDISIVPIVASLTLYAFLGIESASIPAENVKNPKKNIPKATMIGTLICVLVYFSGTAILFGVLPVEIMQNSPAPFVDAAEKIGGKYMASFVGLGTIIAGIGALNGWILMTGQMPMAASKDKLFPEVFGKQNSKGVPLLGLIIGSVLTSFVMLMNYNDSLVNQFEFLILLSTFICLVPYLFTAASFSLISLRNFQNGKLIKNIIISVFGFLFSIWAIYGSGKESVFYGFILLLSGIPLYVYIKWKNNRSL